MLGSEMAVESKERNKEAFVWTMFPNKSLSLPPATTTHQVDEFSKEQRSESSMYRSPRLMFLSHKNRPVRKVELAHLNATRPCCVRCLFSPPSSSHTASGHLELRCHSRFTCVFRNTFETIAAAIWDLSPIQLKFQLKIFQLKHPQLELGWRGDRGFGAQSLCSMQPKPVALWYHHPLLKALAIKVPAVTLLTFTQANTIINDTLVLPPARLVYDYNRRVRLLVWTPQNTGMPARITVLPRVYPDNISRLHLDDWRNKLADIGFDTTVPGKLFHKHLYEWAPVTWASIRYPIQQCNQIIYISSPGISLELTHPTLRSILLEEVDLPAQGQREHGKIIMPEARVKRKDYSKRKAAAIDDVQDNYVRFHNPTLRQRHFTITSNAGSSTTSSVVGRAPPKQSLHPPSSTATSAPEAPKVQQDSNKPTQHEANPFAGKPCNCGREGMVADTQCYDCTGYGITCQLCFVEAHMQNPFHWAEVWDENRRYFVRHDISVLSVGHVVQLGHVVDANGIHSTHLAFCGCQEQPPNKIRQLMRARLFPGTARDPHTAFTINVLKQFQLHNLESKKAAYDYLKAIRRLTDNAFTNKIPDPYESFLRVIRIFNFLTMKKRSGRLHGIDSVLSHRPSGNLLVWCPGCPEPGFNSDPNCLKTPHNLRHLNQSQRTLDGNFQCNRFIKNSDPDDVSLCAGKGYFPLETEYKTYLASIPVSKEKSTCNYLNVVNKQDKKKFKNMAVTGTVNCQCSHVFILSSVDLQYGEPYGSRNGKHPNEPFKIILKLEIEDVDEVATYDIACEYVVRLPDHFGNHFPDLVDSVKQMRWGVLALHVQGHQDSCIYLFGTAYVENVGHFHGESAEQYWPEANQLGPHTRQMNNGYRQDTLINHHGDWNWKKTMKLGKSPAPVYAQI
ncbi:hypothetical protein C8J57DRAFT_1476804 [Mycena rebaudengoi]|nr:hypothetical protein C8J57DRAFT_1476804 [Mycena rebaudengoi]